MFLSPAPFLPCELLEYSPRCWAATTNGTFGHTIMYIVQQGPQSVCPGGTVIYIVQQGSWSVCPGATVIYIVQQGPWSVCPGVLLYTLYNRGHEACVQYGGGGGISKYCRGIHRYLPTGIF